MASDLVEDCSETTEGPLYHLLVHDGLDICAYHQESSKILEALNLL